MTVLGPLEIRSHLRGWVERNLGVGANDALIDELGFVNKPASGSVDNSYRADLALANGRLVGFEIKSGADNLKRWADQCQAYHRVFDEVWLCTHGKHLEKALPATPKETGILLVDDFGGLAVLRMAKRSKSIDPYDLTGLLWREDLERLCMENGLKVKARDTKRDVRALISRELDLSMIRDRVLQQLKQRRLN